MSAMVSAAIDPAPAGDRLLEVTDLRTYFYTEEGEIRAVDGASFSVKRGGTLAVVGESGCGKSVTAYSILRLINKPGQIVGGSVKLYPEGEAALDVLALPARSEQLFRVRGGLVAMIFQEPLSALSPVHTIGNQICEAILLHQRVSRDEATRLATEMLTKVGIPEPAARLKQYPHELSGGMRQRVVIAMALVCNPMLLIADEPTTALDVTLQAQILRLLKELQAKLGTAILLITHDLAVVAQTADEVVVMYCGRVVERAPVRAIMKRPRHPYTQGLLLSLPNIHQRGAGQAKRLPSIAGSVPALTDLPPGCPFHPRCPHAVAGRCDTGAPPALRALGPDHDVACVRAEEIAVRELEADAVAVARGQAS
jgi:peptide/nickel transport system ATP-binding protein